MMVCRGAHMGYAEGHLRCSGKADRRTHFLTGRPREVLETFHEQGADALQLMQRIVTVP